MTRTPSRRSLLLLPALLVVAAFLSGLPAHPVLTGAPVLDARLRLSTEERLTIGEEGIDAPVTFHLSKDEPEDFLPIEPEAQDFSDMRIWQIRISASDGRKVAHIQGRGMPSSSRFPWSRLDDKGEALPDGFYQAQFVWLDEGGRLHRTPNTTVSVFTPLTIRALLAAGLGLRYTDEGLVLRILEVNIFPPGRAELAPAALPMLGEIVTFLRGRPGNRVVVRGHTDSSGSPTRNLELSRRRAFLVYQHLVNNGIDPARLSYEGLGATRPLASEETADGRAQNRRVEVVVLKRT